LRLRDRGKKDMQSAVAAVLMALGLRLTRHWEGERRLVSLPEQEEEGGGLGGLEKEGKWKEQLKRRGSGRSSSPSRKCLMS